MSKTILIRALLVLSLLGFTAYGVRTILNSENQLQLNRVELKSTTSELKSLEQQFDDLNKQYEKKDADTKKLDQERQKLQDELEQAKRDLQAKRAEEARVARLKASQPVYAAEAPSGDWVAQCHAWAAQAGIALDNSAITLLGRESKCNPTICNPNGVACGIPQALPWTKMGCDLSYADAPCQLKWFESYVMGRYGSYANALAHSYNNNWY